MKRGVRCRVACVLAVVVAAAAAGPAAARGGRAARGDPVQKALDRVVTAGAPGALALAAGPSGVKAWTAGAAQLRPRARMRTRDRFRIASVTKPFVATVVLQLVGEGVLSLDDTVERWLPGKLSNGAAITIRELLGHRTGLANWVDHPDFFGPYLTGERPLAYEWTPEQLLALSTALPPAFAPNTHYGYSNTNYLLLRMIVETATNQPLPALLQQRIFAPLGMRATSVDDNPGLAGPASHGYLLRRIPGVKRVGRMSDVTAFNVSAWWGTGDMSSTARDLARFFRALAGGKLLRPDLLDAMFDSPSGVHYGLGVQRLPTASPCGLLYGHEGNTPGYATSAFTTRTGRFSVLMVNRNDLVPVPGGFKLIVASAKAVQAASRAACHL